MCVDVCVWGGEVFVGRGHFSLKTLSRFETGNPQAACDMGKLSRVLLHDFFLLGEDRADCEDTPRRGWRMVNAWPWGS